MDNHIKSELHRLIDNCDDELLLEETKALLQSETDGKDWWDELTEEDRNAILQSEAEYEKGNFISHQDFIQRMEEWRKK